MILGCGIDSAEVSRIRAAIERFGRRFLERVFTPAELAYVESKGDRWGRYAARFAAKEAGMKALGTGWRRGVGWRQLEVVNLASGKPTLKLHGQAARIAAQMGVRNVSLSLTHTREAGLAVVVMED